MNVSRPINPFIAVRRAFDFNDNVNGSSPDPFQKKSSKRMSCSDESELLTVFTSEKIARKKEKKGNNKRTERATIQNAFFIDKYVNIETFS